MKKKLMALFLGMMLMAQIVPQTVGAAQMAHEVTVDGTQTGKQYDANKIGQVTNLKCSSYTTKSINISWKQVPGVTGYEILRANARDGKYKNIMNVAAGNGAFCNRSVKPGTEYYYKVRAYVKRGSKISTGKASKMLAAHTKMTTKSKGKTRVNSNLRKSAGVNGTYITTLKKGTKVTVVCRTTDRKGTKWYKLTTKSGKKKITGYMRADLVTL